jgi:hypothetical protein
MMDGLSPDELRVLGEQLIVEAKDELRYNKLRSYHPYKRQSEFHEAGATKRERLLMAANQSGKAL